MPRAGKAAREMQACSRGLNPKEKRNPYSGKRKSRVLIADDHPVVRRGLQYCLSARKDFTVVGEASNAEDAVQKALQLLPDVVLMDISMPGASSALEATQKLRRQAPDMRVLVLTTDNNRDTVFGIIRSGANGYVSKEAPTDKLLETIQTVLAGKPLFSPELREAAWRQVGENGKRNSLTELSVRDREVLVMVAEGKTNKQMAAHLRLGVRAVETHRERIMDRLDIHTVAGLTRFAVANRLVGLEIAAT